MSTSITIRTTCNMYSQVQMYQGDTSEAMSRENGWRHRTVGERGGFGNSLPWHVVDGGCKTVLKVSADNEEEECLAELWMPLGRSVSRGLSCHSQEYKSQG